jgi:hypothetical protein
MISLTASRRSTSHQPGGVAMPKEAAETGVRRGTGRDRPEWFALLDEWGAASRPYRETAAWLRDEHGLTAWWAQKLTVEYEQARGVRAPGVRKGGTFEITASKAIDASVDRVFEAVVEPTLREQWLRGQAVRVRATRPGRQARFDWGDAGERVTASFVASGHDRSQVAIQHERLPDLAAADAAKAAWRGRLSRLKALLEG